MIKEALEKYNLDRIALPNMYLVHIPGRPTEPVSDNNYVIVEAKIDGDTLSCARHVWDHEILKNDPERMRQFDIVKKYADLWDNSGANYMIRQNVLYPIDTEQPNNQPPSNFLER